MPQSNIGNPLYGWRIVGFIDRYLRQGIHLLRPWKIRDTFPSHIISLINHDPAFYLMRSQPSGTPPIRDNGDDHEMVYRKYFHVQTHTLHLREYYIRTIHQNPPNIVLRVLCHNEHYFLPLLLFVVFVTHKIDWSFKEKIVAITHVEHLSRLLPRMCTLTIPFPALTYRRRNATASSCTSSLNWKDNNTSSLELSSKKRHSCI